MAGTLTLDRRTSRVVGRKPPPLVLKLACANETTTSHGGVRAWEPCARTALLRWQSDQQEHECALELPVQSLWSSPRPWNALGRQLLRDVWRHHDPTTRSFLCPRHEGIFSTHGIVRHSRVREWRGAQTRRRNGGRAWLTLGWLSRCGPWKTP